MNKLINTTVRTMMAAASAEAPKVSGTGAAVQNTTTKELPVLPGKGDPTVPGTPAYNAVHLSDGRSLGQVMNDISKDDLKETYTFADKAYDIQYGAGGIEELQGRLKTLENSVGEQVYAIARIAYTHCEGKLLIVASYFKALCKNAEEHLVARHVEESRAAGNAEELPISKLIPQWSVYKSIIAKGLEMGIDPDQRREGSVTAENPKGSALYPTVAKYAKAVDAKVKETGTSNNGTGSQAGNTRNSQDQTSTIATLQTKGWSPLLAAAMSTMCQELNRLTHEEQDKFAERILQIGHDAKAVAEAAHRAVLTQPTKTMSGESPADQVSAEELDPGTKAAMQAALDEAKGAVGPQQPSRGGSARKKGARAA